MGLISEPTSSQGEHIIWPALRTLWANRWIVITITGIAAIGSVVISLLLPNWYRAETRLLLPGRAASGLLQTLAAGSAPVTATSLLGGITGDYQRHLSILDSRTVKESVVHTFDLANVYDLADTQTPMHLALLTLSNNVAFVVDQEYNHLSVRVMDKDPQRAADMANFFVDELNRVNATLASQNARAFREKVEQRYISFESDLAEVNASIRDLQAHSGIMDMAAQAEAFMTGMSEVRMSMLITSIEYDRLHFLYGEEHSAVRSAKRALEAIRAEYDAALTGQEALLPVAQDSLPELALQFLEFETERLILGELLAYTRPVLEEARLEEQRQIEAVEIIDPAVPPVEKARPARAVICVASTASGFILSVLFVLLMTWWHSSYAAIARKLRGT